jgi:hypothetical protein
MVKLPWAMLNSMAEKLIEVASIGAARVEIGMGRGSCGSDPPLRNRRQGAPILPRILPGGALSGAWCKGGTGKRPQKLFEWPFPY